MHKDEPGFCRKDIVPCEQCPTRTPFRPDHQNLRRAKKLIFEPPLDEGIREIVVTLPSNGVGTFESCEGGDGQAFPWPTVRFEGAASEGLRALSVALENGLPADCWNVTIRRAIAVVVVNANLDVMQLSEIWYA